MLAPGEWKACPNKHCGTVQKLFPIKGKASFYPYKSKWDVAPSAAHGCRLKLIKPGIGWQCEQLWAHQSCLYPFHSSISAKQGRSLLELAVPQAWQRVRRKSQVLSRSRIFEIVPVPSSILAPASHYRHDGCLGSLAPELSLPHHHLGWQESPESVSAMKIFEAAWILILLLWFYVWCAKYWCTSNTGWFNG